MSATDADYCELTELERSMCSHCRGLDAPRERPVVHHRFHARFGGKCDACGDGYRVDDHIGVTVDGEYVCSRCAEPR